MRRMVKGLAVAAAVTTLAGCAVAPGVPVEGSDGTPKVHPSWISCASAVPQPSAESGMDAVELPRLDGDFIPAAVIVCGTQVQRRADGGQDLLATENRADGAALVAALQLPDEAATDGACTAEPPLVPWFALLDEQGRWVRPGCQGTGAAKSGSRCAMRTLALVRAVRPGLDPDLFTRCAQVDVIAAWPVVALCGLARRECGTAPRL
jgi:hypothetical protein